MIKNILFVLLFFCFFQCSQNPPLIIWKKIIGGIDNDEAFSIQQTSDGGYIFAGYTNSFSVGENDFWLVKTDENGIEEWNHAYGGINGDIAKSVQQTSDKGYVMAGITWSFGAGEGDFWVVKTDSLGKEEWNRTFGGTLGDHAESIQQTNDGGYIITGGCESFGAAIINVFLVKLDRFGELEWEQTFGSSGVNVGYSVLQADDHGFVIGGFKSTPDHDFWLFKTDRDGNLEWEQTYGGTESVEQVREIRQTFDKGYIVAGRTRQNDTRNINFLLVKTDSLGNEEWKKTFGGAESNMANSVVQTEDNGYLIAGSIFPFDSKLEDIWLIKTDEFGNLEWDNIIGEKDSYETVISMQLTSDGNYILAGSVNTYEADSKDILIIKGQILDIEN